MGWNTRSVWEELRRFIRAQKFYSTLSSKIKRAENDWLDTQPSNEISRPEFIEHEPDGSEAQRLLGGALQLKSEFVEDDNLPTG